MYESAQHFKAQNSQFLPFYHFINDQVHIQNILQSQAPLVSIKEINQFRQLVAKAAVGKYFLIQLGDYNEGFFEDDKHTTNAKLDFMQQLASFFYKKTGYDVIQVGQIAGLHTSQNASLLYHEQALTRLDKQTGLHYNLSTHFPWLDKHTINSIQHINYLKKIANPIALKVGPDTSITNLIKTIDELDPDYLPGRITLIPGLGSQSIHHLLPQLIEAVNKTQRTVLWSCDPMSGNNETNSSGIKIRELSNIVEEIKSSFLIHKKMGSKLNAIHLEATYQDVTECVDYESSICDSVTDFKKTYKSLAEPRLNYEQTMHVIQSIAKHYVDVIK